MNRRILTAAVLAATAVLSGCGSAHDDTATAVCVDANGVRLPDTACRDTTGGNTWLWFLIGQQFGGVGSRVYGGYYTPPTSVHHYYYGGAPTGGGTVPSTGRYAGGRASAAPAAPHGSTAKPRVSAPVVKPTPKPAAPSVKPAPKVPVKPKPVSPPKVNLGKPPAVKMPAPRPPHIK